MNAFFKNKAARVAILLLLTFGLVGCFGILPLAVEVQRNLEYANVDGQSMLLDIYRPKQPVGKLPVVVWIYGGSWKHGSKSPCPIGFMATQNLAIVSINYRLSTSATFPAQLYDCKSAIRWLRANAAKFDLDSDHIGVFGASAGGHLALLLATTGDNKEVEGAEGGNLNFSSKVQCVCAFYPPTDLNLLVTNPATRVNPNGDVAMLIGGAVADNISKANAASPITYLNKNCAPVFLMHGGADRLVPVQQSVEFYDAALKAGVDARLEIIPNKGHGIIAPPPVAKEIYKFFADHLDMKNATPPTSR